MVTMIDFTIIIDILAIILVVLAIILKCTA